MRVVAIVQARMGSERLPGKPHRRTGAPAELTARIERAPRTLKAVFAPAAFEPFARIPDAPAFEAAWQASPHAVLANMAHAAYHRCGHVRDVMARLGARRTCVIARGTADPPDAARARAFLSVWPDKAILSFRGTASLADVATDAWCLRAPLNGAKVHRGFLGRFRRLWEMIGAQVEAAGEGGGRAVWATGHSLGGAVALLAATRYAFAEVVTFGEPRGGIGLDAAFRAGRHLRYHNGRDPVVVVPPLPGFRHHGQHVVIEDPRGRSVVYDHSIVYYAEILEMRG